METLQEHIQSSKRSGNIEFFIESRSETAVVSRMPVTPGIQNPFGSVQAGAMIWLADVTASILVLEAHGIGENGKGFPLAVDIHTTLVGNLRDGEIKAEAQFVRQGRKVSVVRTRLTGENDKLLADVTSTHVPAG